MPGPRDANSLDRDRLLIGFISIPPVAALATFGLFYFTSLIWPGYDQTVTRDAAVSVGAGAGIIALALTLVIVGPIVMHYVRGVGLSLRRSVLLGASLGNIPAILVAASARRASANAGDLPWTGSDGAMRVLLLGTLVGSVCALIFWVIAISGTSFGSNTSREV